MDGGRALELEATPVSLCGRITFKHCDIHSYIALLVSLIKIASFASQVVVICMFVKDFQTYKLGIKCDNKLGYFPL